MFTQSLKLKIKLPLNALLGIDQFIKAKYLLKKNKCLQCWNEWCGKTFDVDFALNISNRSKPNYTLKLKKILSLIVYTSLSERNNMRFSSSIFKKLRIN